MKFLKKSDFETSGNVENMDLKGSKSGKQHHDSHPKKKKKEKKGRDSFFCPQNQQIQFVNE